MPSAFEIIASGPRTRPSRLVACAALALLGAAVGLGCSAKDGASSASADGGFVPTGVAAVEADAIAAARAKLVGSYAVQMHISTVSTVPLVKTATGVERSTTTYGLAEVTASGDQVVLHERWCHTVVSADALLGITYKDAVPEGIAPTTTVLGFHEQAGVVFFTRPQTVSLLGARLTNPLSEALPTTETDPRVVDEDGDGKPGYTTALSTSIGLNGDVYLVRRLVTTYAGDTSGSFLRQLAQGTADAGAAPPSNLTYVALTTDGTEQAVVGSTSSVLSTELDGYIDTSFDKTYVLMARLPAAYDCDRVRAEQTTLFAPF